MSEEIKTVRMHRQEPAHEGGPSVADVHPDEEANWAGQGWERAPEPKPEPTRKADKDKK